MFSAEVVLVRGSTTASSCATSGKRATCTVHPDQGFKEDHSEAPTTDCFNITLSETTPITIQRRTLAAPILAHRFSSRAAAGQTESNLLPQSITEFGFNIPRHFWNAQSAQITNHPGVGFQLY